MRPKDVPEEIVETGAKLLAQWITYGWDGLSDRDISDRFPDWTTSVRGSFQGGKPALRKMAAGIMALAAAAERERCAKVAETAQMAGTIKPDGFYVGPNAPHAIASAIRALPDTGE